MCAPEYVFATEQMRSDNINFTSTIVYSVIQICICQIYICRGYSYFSLDLPTLVIASSARVTRSCTYGQTGLPGSGKGPKEERIIDGEEPAEGLLEGNVLKTNSSSSKKF